VKRFSVLQHLVLAAAATAALAGPARAGDIFDSTTLRPASGGDGLVGVEGARVPNIHDQVLDVKLWGIGDHAPVALGAENVYNRVRAVLAIQAKITEGFAVGLQIPLTVHQHGGLKGGFGATGDLATGLGSVRLTPRLGLLDQGAYGVNLALQGSVELPTSVENSVAGSARPQVEGLISASRIWGEAKDAHFELIGNLLVGNREQVTVSATELAGTYVGARVGGAYYLGEELLRRVFAEVDGKSRTSDFGGTAGTPVEARAGLSLCFGRFIAFDLAAGARLISAVGAPDWHVVGGLGYSPATCRTTVPPPPGPSASEIAAKQAADAAAAKAAEEKAVAEKAAADKLAAEKAAAAKAAADKAAADKLAAEKAAAEQAAAAAKAEEEAAKKDTDGDGVPDRADNCPTEKGPASNSGCPEAKKQKVVVRDGKIDILEKVQFAVGKAVILKSSFPLLDQVAGVLKSHPEIAKLEVQGHTDNVGPAPKNLKLSGERAAAVVTYLAQKGVDKGTLIAKGYGEEKPIADNKTKKGQEENRRVEFKVLEMKKAQ
jgi:outer membrane protein OmpA-like peptidoglycan-associated protein